MSERSVILLNLGGPDTLKAVKPFLYNLFSDREIIRLGPAFLQRPLACLIAAIRAPKTRRAYSLIGGGSPILRITREQAHCLKRVLQPHGEFDVLVGMKYWHPYIRDALKEAAEKGAEMIIGLSLYPQYSRATTGSTKKDFDEEIRKYRIPIVRFIDSWYSNPLYIQAIKELVLKKLESTGIKDTHLLFSAHSLPVSFLEEGDPYEREIKGTVEAILSALRDAAHELPPHSIGYQSRTGPVRWLGPSTDEEIRRLAGKGVKRVIVVPVSFVSDHIETLYEIDILYRELAERLGMVLERVDSLNTHPTFINALKEIVLKAI